MVTEESLTLSLNSFNNLKKPDYAIVNSIFIILIVRAPEAQAQRYQYKAFSHVCLYVKLS